MSTPLERCGRFVVIGFVIANEVIHRKSNTHAPSHTSIYIYVHARVAYIVFVSFVAVVLFLLTLATRACKYCKFHITHAH